MCYWFYVCFALRATCFSPRILLWGAISLLLVIEPRSVTASSAAHTALISPEQFRPVHRLTVNEGLSQDLCIFIHQDARGFMWFGTAGGLDRYDGVELKPYRHIDGIPRQPVYFYSCFEENDTTMWFGTDVGLLRYNPATNQGRMLSVTTGISPESPLHIAYITAVRPGVLLYAVNEVELVRLETATTQHSVVMLTQALRQSVSDRIVSIATLGSGKALLLVGGRMIEYDDQTRSLRVIAVLPSGLSGNCFWVDRTNDIVWIGTTRGLYKFAGNTMTGVPLPHHGGVAQREPAITALLGDTRGRVWLGLVDGLAAFHPELNTLTTYTEHPGNPGSLQSGTISSLFADRTENLWIAVHDKGIARLDLKPLKFNVISNHPAFPPQLAGTGVSGLAVTPEGNMWVWAEGLHFVDFQRNTITRISLTGTTLENTEERRFVRILAVTDSLICMRSPIAGRVFVFDLGRRALRSLVVDGREYTEVKNIFLRPSTKNLVLFLADSIVEVNLERRQRVATLAHNASTIPRAAVCTSILEDHTGTLWFGTNHGLLVHDVRQGLRRFEDLSAGDGVAPHQPVLSLALSGSNVLWVGTDAGLRRIDLTTRSTRSYTAANSLPNDKIWIVHVDSHNSIWLGTNRGLVRLTERRDGSTAVRVYTVADGLPSNEFSMNVKGTDGKGTLFFGTGKGIVYWSPETLTDNPHAPTVVLTNARLYGISMMLERDVPFVNQIVVPYEKKILSFSYAALEFTDPARNTYSYFLEGYDHGWNNVGTRREAFYTNLDPGTYTFHVKAANSDGVWSVTGATVELVIVPPFWMTWWFRAFAIAALLGIIGGSIRYLELRKIKTRLARLEQERALERERTRISRDMHDELGANLTSLSMITEIVRRSLDDPTHADEHLRKAGSIALDTVRKLDEIVWAVNPKADTLASLAGYISEYAQEFFSTSSIHLRFEFPMRIPDIPLASDVRHNLFVVIKEALNNIVKHSGATEAGIALTVRDGSIAFEVRDNGKGFDLASQRQFGNGMRNMQERVQAVGGTLSVVSTPGKGTVVGIEINRV